jgi:hypothetical protein
MQHIGWNQEQLDFFFFETMSNLISIIQTWALLAPRSPDAHGCSPFSRIHAWARTARTSLDCACITCAHTGHVSPAWVPLASPLAYHAHLICNIQSTFEISGCNTCNIQKKRWMKHLKHASKTPEKALEKIANICISR